MLMMTINIIRLRLPALETSLRRFRYVSLCVSAVWNDIVLGSSEWYCNHYKYKDR
jgi:hypothetical protein